MRLSDAKKPAMEWSEAAMLPACVRTMSGGAALRQLRKIDRLNTSAVQRKNAPASVAEPGDARISPMRRAAYRQITRLL